MIRLAMHGFGRLVGEPFGGGIEIPAGTAFNPHLNLKIKHLAQPPAEEETPVTRVPREAAMQSDLAPQAGA